MAASMEKRDSGEDIKIGRKQKRRTTSGDRQGNDSQEGRPQTKKPKEEYTDIEFKVDLRDMSIRFEALEKFKEQANRYPSLTSFDIVENYCKNSTGCVEIFKLLEGEKQMSPKMSAVFAVLELILVTIADRLPQLHTIAMAIVRDILAKQLGGIYYTLKQHKSWQIKTTLKLLSAMVIQGGTSPHDVLSCFDFQNLVVPPLFQKRDTKDPQDIRTCLLQFIMSFIVAGDDHVRRQLIQTKGLASSMFEGMNFDKFSTLQLVLPILRENVIQNPDLNKTTKLKLFNNFVLNELGKLYQWVGPTKWTHVLKNKGKKNRRSEEATQTMEGEDMEMTSTQLEDRNGVAEMVHQVLMDICCDLKLGINFYDKSFGASGENQNRTLTSFLTTLPQPQTSSLMSGLVIGVLTACPDQLTWYLPGLKHSLKPRVSHKWLTATALLKKIYEAQPAVSPVMRLNEHHPTEKLVSMAMATLFPPMEVWADVLTAVTRSSPVMQSEGLSIVLLVLRRVAATLHACTLDNTVYSPSELNAFATALRDSVAKECPNMAHLLQCWAQSVKSDNKEAPNKKSTQEVDDDGDSDIETAVTQGVPVVSQVDHLLQVLQVLCEYQSVLPDVFRRHVVNFGLLLEGVRGITTSDDTSEDQGSLLQLHLLRLLAESSVRQLSWMQESIRGRSTLYLLLEMVIITKNNQKMLLIATNLLQKLFMSTGLFEHNRDELAIWLTELAMVPGVGERSQVLAFLEKVFTAVLKDPYSYTDRVSEAVSEAAAVESGITADTGSVATASDQIIDAILSMDEVPLDDTVKDSSTKEESQHEDATSRFPFSALVPAALRVFKEEQGQLKEVPEGVEDYLTATLSRVLLVQVDPLPLSLLIHQDEAASKLPSLQPYLKLWLPKAMSKQITLTQETQKKPGRRSALGNLLAETFIGGLDYILTSNVQAHLLEAVEKFDIEEIESDVRQILLSARTYAYNTPRDERNHEVVTFYLSLLEKVLVTVEEVGSRSEAEASPLHDLSSQFAHLEVAKPNRNDLLLKIYTIILTHPDLQKWFLWTQPFGVKGKIAKRDMNLRKTVTPNMAAIIGVMSVCVVSRLDLVLEKYREKVANELSRYIQMLEGKENDDKDNEVLQALEGFIRLFQWGDELRIAQMLLMLSSKSLANKGVLTKYGTALVSILSHIVDTLESDRAKAMNLIDNFPLESVSRLVKLLTKHNVPSLQDLFRRLLRICPNYALAANQSYLQQCLKGPPGGSGMEVASILVSHSSACCEWFEQYWSELCKQTKEETKWQCLGVVLQYGLALAEENKITASKSKLSQLHTLYWDDLVAWIQTVPDEEKIVSDTKFALLILLTSICTDTGVLQDSWNQILVYFAGTAELSRYQVHYVHAASKALSATNSEDPLPVWEVYTATALKCLTNIVLKKGKSSQEDVISILLGQVQDLLKELREDKGTLAELIQPVWNKFVKAGLKYLYTNAQFLELLSSLIGMVYSCQLENILPAHTVYEMVTSHSLFIGTVLEESSTTLKDALVNLLLMLARHDPASCDSAHLSVLLGGYGASLNKTDQKLLMLLQIYETNKCKMSDYSPYLWGPKAVVHYSLRKSTQSSLWTRPSTEQVLENLDEELLQESILNFPLQRVFRPLGVVEPVQMTTTPGTYDPCFLLPLLGHLIAPGNLVDCQKFVEVGCLSYLLTALSSHDSLMRGAAYHVLSEFYRQTQERRFPAREQVQYLLEVLKNSITVSNVKLSPIVTVFLARAAKLMVTPGVYMYSPVNEFLLLKPTMDTVNVPEFFKLFNSSRLEYKSERAWILSLLADGLRETGDYHIFEKRYAFKLILSFSDAATSDQYTQIQVLKIVLQACRLRKVMSDLTKNHGLLPWLAGVIKTSCGDGDKQRLLINIVGTMWTTLVAGRDEITAKWPYLPPVFTNEVLHLMLIMLHSFRNIEDLEVLQRFVGCLSSVLCHLNKTLASARHMVPVYVKLGAKDIIRILQLWVSIDRQREFELELRTLMQVLQPNKDFLVNEGAPTTAERVTHRVLPRLPVETETSSKDNSKDPVLRSKCIRSILEIVQYWKPDEAPNDSTAQVQQVAECCQVKSLQVAEVSALLYTAEWCLNQVFLLFPEDFQVFNMVLRWFKLWVNRKDVQRVLSTDTITSDHVIGLILSVFGHATKMSTGGWLKPENLANLTQSLADLNGMKYCATEMLAQVIDYANAQNTESGKPSVVQQTLLIPAFKSTLQEVSKAQLSQSDLYLLVQELWMKATKPTHFSTFVEKATHIVI